MLYDNRHQGVVVPMITPFTAEGHVDLEAAEKIINRFIEAQVGVFILGTTGETASVPQRERLKLVERTVEIALDKIPVYAGIGDNCLVHAEEAAQRYLRLGVDAVVAHLPSYYPLNDKEMEDYFRILHKAIDGPIMIYNIPQTTSMSLPLDVVESLSHLPHFVGFKDSERCADRLEECSRRFAGRDNFALFMGSAVLSCQALKAGFHGLVPGSGNLVPELWARMMELARNNDWEEAGDLQERLDAIAHIFQKDRTLGQSLAALKALMHELGLCQPYVLPPLSTLPDLDQAALASVMLSSNHAEWQKVL